MCNVTVLELAARSLRQTSNKIPSGLPSLGSTVLSHPANRYRSLDPLPWLKWLAYDFCKPHMLPRCDQDRTQMREAPKSLETTKVAAVEGCHANTERRFVCSRTDQSALVVRYTT